MKTTPPTLAGLQLSIFQFQTFSPFWKPTEIAMSRQVRPWHIRQTGRATPDPNPSPGFEGLPLLRVPFLMSWRLSTPRKRLLRKQIRKLHSWCQDRMLLPVPGTWPQNERLLIQKSFKRKRKSSTHPGQAARFVYGVELGGKNLQGPERRGFRLSWVRMVISLQVGLRDHWFWAAGSPSGILWNATWHCRPRKMPCQRRKSK